MNGSSEQTEKKVFESDIALQIGGCTGAEYVSRLSAIECQISNPASELLTDYWQDGVDHNTKHDICAASNPRTVSLITSGAVDFFPDYSYTRPGSVSPNTIQMINKGLSAGLGYCPWEVGPALAEAAHLENRASLGLLQLVIVTEPLWGAHVSPPFDSFPMLFIISNKKGDGKVLDKLELATRFYYPYDHSLVNYQWIFMALT